MTREEIEQLIAALVKETVSVTVPQFAPLVDVVQDIVDHLLPGAPTLAQHQPALDDLAQSIATQAESAAK